MTDHEQIMRRCLDNAQQAQNRVAPNPMVGACLVHDGRIIAEGIHEAYGQPHAEVHAIRQVTDAEILSRSTLYVTLEPCSHHGKTPPCADLVIKSGIRSVVVATGDPNPRVAGQGIQRLREHGISVVENILAEEARFLNRRFFTAHMRQRPYIILKWAQTSDGFTARRDFSSRWISGEHSRQLVHEWRAEEQAILIGGHTAVVDNPQLTVRHTRGRNPLRLVIDSKGSLPAALSLWNAEAPTICYTIAERRAYGCEEVVPLKKELPFLPQILNHLHERKVQSVLVEGGTKIHQQFINQNLWDEARIFTAPATFGEGIPAPVLPAVHTASETLLADITQQSGEDQLEKRFNPTLKTILTFQQNSSPE